MSKLSEYAKFDHLDTDTSEDEEEKEPENAAVHQRPSSLLDTCKICRDRSSMFAVVTEEPCPACGWFTAIFSGERFPPGFCATSWRYAKERIDMLVREFPKLSLQVVTDAVRKAGQDDMNGDDARAILMQKAACR